MELKQIKDACERLNGVTHRTVATAREQFALERPPNCLAVYEPGATKLFFCR